MVIVDQLHRTINFNNPPKRIISLVPSQTELLYDLGLESNIVGVTKFCVHPHHIKTNVTVVGGTKQINLEKVKALWPDIILCNKEENTKGIVEACQSVCAVHVSVIFTIADSFELIRQYGHIFKKEQEAFALAEKIKTEVAEFKLFIRHRPILKVAYFIWRRPWMVVANNTFINYLLELNKFDNIYKDKVRYPEVDLAVSDRLEVVDVVLLSSEPYPFKEKHKKEIQEYYPKAKIVLVDGEMFSWYGSRMLKAFEYFKKLQATP